MRELLDASAQGHVRLALHQTKLAADSLLRTLDVAQYKMFSQ